MILTGVMKSIKRNIIIFWVTEVVRIKLANKPIEANLLCLTLRQKLSKRVTAITNSGKSSSEMTQRIFKCCSMATDELDMVKFACWLSKKDIQWHSDSEVQRMTSSHTFMHVSVHLRLGFLSVYNIPIHTKYICIYVQRTCYEFNYHHNLIII